MGGVWAACGQHVVGGGDVPFIRVEVCCVPSVWCRKGKEDDAGQAWIAIEFTSAKAVGCVKLYQALTAQAAGECTHRDSHQTTNTIAQSLLLSTACTHNTLPYSDSPHPPPSPPASWSDSRH